ncbi:MAG: mitochondrial fission ELM1 family protein [Candidatus Omnitrophica bacterium]|nr:mitochondrial fission ELM1 family protein [Candidatus Omnitrophota bacterium]
MELSSCWIVTEKLAGLQNQAIGLCEALGLPYSLKEIKKPQNLWQRLFPPHHGLVPPWPDVLVSCGRQSVPVSLHIRSASAGHTFTIHIQDPFIDPKNFDVVVVPEHDKLQGHNVLATRGAIHHVNQKKLAFGAGHFAERLSHLPRPLIGVLVGGKNRHHDFSEKSARELASMLSQAAQKNGGSIALTFSRRTGSANETLIRSGLQEIPAYIWDSQGENPYFGLLALADVIITTSDSISMVSEACYTGKPVYVYPLPGGGKRHKEFLKDLIQRGIIRFFEENIETWSYPPLDETKRAAVFIRQRFLNRKTSDQKS